MVFKKLEREVKKILNEAEDSSESARLKKQELDFLSINTFMA
jgi:hypothetical protein